MIIIVKMLNKSLFQTIYFCIYIVSTLTRILFIRLLEYQKLGHKQFMVKRIELYEPRTSQ